MKVLVRILIAIILQTAIFAQSSYLYRMGGKLDVNRINTVFSNFGVTAQPHINGYSGFAYGHPYNGYIGDFSFFIGVELPVRDYTGDGTPDTLHGVVITPVSRPGGGKDINGQFSGFEPLPGYSSGNILDDQGIAISDMPATWPQVWPDHPEYGTNVWNGLYGANTYIPGREALYVVDDANEIKYNWLYGFIPDSTNPSRKGYGLEVKVRIIQSVLPGLEDALIYVYDITNKGKTTYNKVAFGELFGTYVGVEGVEWNDDYSVYYPREDMTYIGDYSESINPADNPRWIGKPRKIGSAFIQAPGMQKTASSKYFVSAANIQMANDEDMWKRMKPGTRDFPSSVTYSSDSIPYVSHGDDGDFQRGTNYFSLAPGEHITLSSAIVFGKSDQQVYDKLLDASAMYYHSFNQALIAATLSCTSHQNNPVVSGNSSIQWQSSAQGQGTLEIAYSPDNGLSWKTIAWNAPNTGTYLWNTNDYPDSKVGKLRLVYKNSYGEKTAVARTNIFTLNNSVNGKPFANINNIGEDTLITDAQIMLNFTVADPEDQPVTVKVFSYMLGAIDSVLLGEASFASDVTPQTMMVPIARAKNSNATTLKLYVSDGTNTTITVSEQFKKQTTVDVLAPSRFVFVSGHTQTQVAVRIGDRGRLRSENYTVTFNDTLTPMGQKYFSVWNNDLNIPVVQNRPLIAGAESEMFDGLYLNNNDFITRNNELLTGWTLAQPTAQPKLTVTTYGGTSFKHWRSPRDYKLVFSNTYDKTSYPLPYAQGGPYPVKNVNYQIFDVTDGTPKPVQFAHLTTSSAATDSLSFDDAIYLANEPKTGLAWILLFNGNSNSYVPRGGDTLSFYTVKGLSYYDTLFINNILVGVASGKTVESFNVSQNYPNPFNPATTINYIVPQRNAVRIEVFNTLGQLVKTVVDAEQLPGAYSVQVNMGGCASGLYFYRVSIGEQQVTRKMMLLK